MTFHLRFVAAIVVGALALVGFTAVGAQACACGVMIAPEGDHVGVDAERAIVKLDSGVETIAMQMNMLGGAKDTALVVPTPSPARVSAADKKMFKVLDDFIEPDVRVVNDWWPDRRGDSGVAAKAAGAPDVVRQVQVGPLEATTLKGGTAKGLKKWLRAHDYVVPAAVRAGLNRYVKRGWSFVAVRLNSSADLAGGTPPLLIKFKSQTLVYPMRLSQAATTPQNVQVYLVGQHKMTRADRASDGSVEGNPSLQWAGRVDATNFDNAGLKQFFGTNDYLTVYLSHYDDPPNEITTDYRFVRAGDDDPWDPVVTKHHEVKVGGIFAGPLITAAVIALALAGAITAFVRTVRRRRRTPRA